MDIGEALKLALLWLSVAGYVLLALELFARALYALVSRRRGAGKSVEGPARVSRLNRSAGAVFKSGVRGLLGGGGSLHSWASARIYPRRPREPAGFKAQAGVSPRLMGA